ncbi:MAG: hypothetical protein QM791_18215 [Ferruginibacter sp.]
MEYRVNRYNFKKDLIASGVLTVDYKDHAILLTYEDAEIKESVSELHHPIAALESLRQILELSHKSFIGCNGCRIDTELIHHTGIELAVLHI